MVRSHDFLPSTARLYDFAEGYRGLAWLTTKSCGRAGQHEAAQLRGDVLRPLIGDGEAAWPLAIDRGVVQLCSGELRPRAVKGEAVRPRAVNSDAVQPRGEVLRPRIGDGKVA